MDPVLQGPLNDLAAAQAAAETASQAVTAAALKVVSAFQTYYGLPTGSAPAK